MIANILVDIEATIKTALELRSTKKVCNFLDFGKMVIRKVLATAILVRIRSS